MAPLHLVVDRREGDGDVLAGPGAGHPEGSDELGGQHLPAAVGADVVDLAEQDGVLGGGTDADGGGGGAGDAQVAGERGRVERGELAGEVQGDADAERGQLGEAAGAAEAGQGGDAGRAGPGRVGDVLGAAGEGDGAPVVTQARVGGRARAAQLGGAVGGVDASGAGDPERRAGVGGPVALQIPVEPGTHACLDPVGLHVAAVVAAGDPVDGDGGAVRADRLLGGVGLVEGEQGVRLPLHEQGGHLDAVADGGRRALPEQLPGGRVGGAGLGDPVVHPAQRGFELLRSRRRC